MRKTITALTLLMFVLVPILAFSMEVTVEITGPQELNALKSGIEKTVTARCVAKGIDLEKYKKLAITISKLGDVISYDALLDTKPARAFHRDLKDTAALSLIIDEMIGAIFIEPVMPQPAPAPPVKPAVGQESIPKIMLPFIATSMTSLGDRVFVCDTKTVYELKGEKTSPLWKVPGKNEIIRIYPYGESLIVLTKLMNDCRTFLISGSDTKERWSKAVVPLGNGLISTNLIFNKAYGSLPYVWSKAAQVTGSSPQVPEGLDIISATPTAGKTPSKDARMISYNKEGFMVVSDGKSIVWTDDEGAGNAPQFIEDERVERDAQTDVVARYYLRPRVIVLGDSIVTFRNSQGSARIVSGFNLFEYSKVVVFTPSGTEFAKNELASFPESYCSDIATVQGKVAALIVKSKNSYVQLLGL
jgi:hypothetical protein